MPDDGIYSGEHEMQLAANGVHQATGTKKRITFGLIVALLASFLTYFVLQAAPASAATGSSCGANVNVIVWPDRTISAVPVTPPNDSMSKTD